MTDLSAPARDILATNVDNIIQLANRYIGSLEQHEWALRQVNALMSAAADRHWSGCTEALRILRMILAQIDVRSARAEAMAALSAAMGAVDECEMLDAIAGGVAGMRQRRMMGVVR